MLKNEADMSSLDSLSWDASTENQLRGVAWRTNETCTPNDLIGLFMPACRKDCWENCAKCICAFSDEKLERFIPRMLEWLMDMNWPGAEVIYSRLLNMPYSILERHITDALRWADESNDEIWREYLEDLAADKKKMDTAK